MRIKEVHIPVTLPDDDFILSQNTTTAGTATSFIVDGAAFPAQRLSLEQNDTSVMSVTLVYKRPWDSDNSYTDVVSVAASSVTTYTTYPVSELISVTWPAVSSKTLKVGFQGNPWFWPGGDIGTDQLIGGYFTANYVDSGGTAGLIYDVTIGTAGTPAADTIAYHAASRTVHYCYPENGSSQAMAGWLTLKIKE